mgnify:FL=1
MSKTDKFVILVQYSKITKKSANFCVISRHAEPELRLDNTI